MRRALLDVCLLALCLVAVSCGTIQDDGAGEVDLEVDPTIPTVPDSVTTTTTTTTTTLAPPEGPGLTVDAVDPLGARAAIGVTLTGFAPGASLVIGQCREEGVLDNPLNVCQLRSTVVADAAGATTATVDVERHISSAFGPVDCAVIDCILGAAEFDPDNVSSALSNAGDRAIAPLSFLDTPPGPLTLTVSAPPPYSDRQELTLTAEPNEGVGNPTTQVCQLAQPDVCTESPTFFGPFPANRMQYFPAEGYLDCGVIGCQLVVSTSAGQRATAPLEWTGPAPPPVVVTADVPFQYVEGTVLTFRVDGAAHFTGIHLQIDHPDGSWNQPVWWPSRGDFRVPFIDDDTIQFEWALHRSEDSNIYDDCITVGCEFTVGFGSADLASYPFILVPLE